MAVIVQVFGGLGNQMFQYAAGRALSYRLQMPLKLDLSRFEDYPLRSYKLSHFNIQEEFATPGDLEAFSIPEKGLPLILFRAKNFMLSRHQKKIFIEKKGGFDEDFHRISRSCWLKGYWQSEKYFKPIEKLIRREFKLQEKPDPLNRELLRDISEKLSVSIHVRRGDYVKNPVTNEYHGFLGKAYYDKAIQYFESKIKSPVFFVFSDDIEWAENNLKTEHPMVFVNHNGEKKDYEDLRLMWNCKYHIIANSSFSWWGAWLNNDHKKEVVAPKQWFSEKEMKKRGTIEIVPTEWYRL
jgi:hypothetical protein